jgi:hypothetical protein
VSKTRNPGIDADLKKDMLVQSIVPFAKEMAKARKKAN